MRLAGLLRGDNGGLGTLSRLCHHGLGFHRTLTLHRIPGERGDFCATNTETNRVAGDSITVADVHWLCQGADALLSFETFYSDMVPRLAKQMGLRVALCLMYEMTPERAEWMQYVDVVLCPTGLDFEEAERTPWLSRAKKVLLPIPADVERIAFRQRERAEVFVHRVGHQGDSGRNGTEAILKAWPLLKSSAKLLLYHQNDLKFSVPSHPNIECRRTNFPNYWCGYGEGDVFIHPSQHDALSLPIQEALASGLPVIASDWWPHCDDGGRIGCLPAWSKEYSIPVSQTVRQRMCREFTSHRVSPQSVAEVVDRVCGTDVSQASREAREWAEARSWDRLRQQWLDALAG